MGAYRSKPVTDKISSDESGKYVKCGASSMQGWRVTQEDAHNCIIEFDENASLFAVYDGHGGHEVAQYCSENLPQYLKECASYKSGEYTKALEEAFLGFDATLVEPKVVKVLNNIVKSADDAEESENQNSGSEDEENIRNLYEEAQMPLEEVMAKYQSDGLNPALKKLKGGTPPSPYLVAKQSGKIKVSEEAGSSKAGNSSSSSSSSNSSSSSSSSSSTSSGAVEAVEESSNESAAKDGEESKLCENKENENTTDQRQESNGDKAVDNRKETNGDKTSQKDSSSSQGNSAEESEEATSEKTLQVTKDNIEESATKKVKKECGKEEEGLKDEPSVEKKQTDSHLKKDKESDKQEETKEVKKEKKKSPIKKLEVNGDVEPKDLKKESENEPHENGDVAEEESDDENEKEPAKSRKGKGKAIMKKSEKPKRMSARQRNVAILFRSILAAQDSADSESDDEGDESFQGAEERSSSEDEDKEEAEAEGEEEEEDDDGEEEEEEEEGEEEEEEEEECEDEDLPKINAEQPGVESGCTAVVALLHGRDLYVANAGDSRCIVSRSGEALDMSLDHKPEDDIEIKRISAAGGFVSCDGRVNGGLNLSRAIGDHAYKQTENLPPEEQMITALPDVRTLSIDTEKDEFMVLACDGIWNSMTSQEVVNFVRTRLQSGEEKLLSQICEELFDFCLAPDTASDGTGCDNMTAVIVQFLPALAEAKSSDLPNTSISTATNKRPASPSENSDSSAKRFKTSVV